MPASPLLQLLDEPLDDVISAVSPNDTMFSSAHGDDYHSYGRSALRCIRLALLVAGKDEPRHILDLPCGHGRVLRMLRAAFPDARLTACDLERDAVDFCASTFGAAPVHSTADFSGIRLQGTFDLIWVGSLLTHLELEGWAALMRLLMPALDRDGLLLFTTHGRTSAERIRTGFGYGLDPDVLPRMLEEYEQEGFAYRDYPDQEGYGISLSSPAWVMKEILGHGSLRVLSYTETGWAEHQDVVVCQRSSDAAWLNPPGSRQSR